MDNSLRATPQEGYLGLKQKGAQLKKNSSRGVRQVGPKKHIVMVLFKSLESGKDCRPKGINKDAALQRLASSTHTPWPETSSQERGRSGRGGGQEGH